MWNNNSYVNSGDAFNSHWNTWTHLAASFDGTRLRMYINGAEEFNGTWTTNQTGASSNAELTIGTDAHGRYINGQIADVRIWTVARTADEIANNKDSTIDPGSSDLIANYLFGDGSDVVNSATTPNKLPDGTYRNGASANALGSAIGNGEVANPGEITITADTPGVPFSLSTSNTSSGGDSAAAPLTLNASDALLTSSGSITFADLDLTDKSNVTRSYSSAVDSAGASLSDALNTALQNIDSAFTISGAGVGSAAHSGTINWNFSIDNALTQYLATDQSIDVTYTISITDDSEVTTGDEPRTATQDVVITINGANDNPVLSVSSSKTPIQTHSPNPPTAQGSQPLAPSPPLISI